MDQFVLRGTQGLLGVLPLQHFLAQRVVGLRQLLGAPVDLLLQIGIHLFE